MTVRSTSGRAFRAALWLLGGLGAAYGVVTALGILIGADATIRARAVRPKGSRVRVRRAGADAVRLPRNADTLSPGVLGLETDAAHLLVGPPRRGRRHVVRPILAASGEWADGARARATTLVYGGTPAQLGLDYQDVTIPAPVGPMPAWHIPPAGELDAVAVVVHGHSGERSHGLRVLPALHRAGLGALYVTFRNAHGAPRTHGLHTLGFEEAEDVLAGLEWAREAGYRRAVLYGFSMGGNIALSALALAGEAPPLPVPGVILDSPALDWRAIIGGYARRFGFPAVTARATERHITRWSGQDFDAVDQLRAAPALEHPILLFHGTADRTVSVAQSDALAAARPDLVEYHRIDGAGHIRGWNLDPEKYEGALREFVARVLSSPSEELSHD